MKNKLSKRLFTIINLVDKNSIVLDVGTDHGHIPIFLVQNNISNKAYGSDISENAVINLQQKIKKLDLENNITIFHNDGIKSINVKYDTLILAGMGYHTIKHIISDELLPKNIIIQSNSKLKEVRKLLNSLNYKIVTEKVIYENKKYYSIIKYEKGKENLSYFHLNFGKSNNKDYYKHLIKHYNNLMKKVPFKIKLKYIKNIILLQFKIIL